MVGTGGDQPIVDLKDEKKHPSFASPFDAFPFILRSAFDDRR